MKTKLTGATTRLERNVQKWANDKAADYERRGVAGVLADLFSGGCASGIAGHLVYTRHCANFFAAHRRDISTLLAEAVSDSGEHDLSKMFSNTKSLTWNELDPLAQEDNNRNILAWFGFEEAARNMAARNGIEI